MGGFESRIYHSTAATTTSTTYNSSINNNNEVINHVYYLPLYRTLQSFVRRQTLLDDPSHMERIMAAIAKLVPAVEPLDGVFKTAVSHHCALRTSNIARAMKFYSLLGMTEVCRFVASRIMVYRSDRLSSTVPSCLPQYRSIHSVTTGSRNRANVTEIILRTCIYTYTIQLLV